MLPSHVAPATWEKERSVPLAINLNTATEAEFMTMPGIGPDLAIAIIEQRRSLGCFAELADLSEVPGMNHEIMAKLEDMMDQARQFNGYVRE
jgi:competence protein ComEA